MPVGSQIIADIAQASLGYVVLTFFHDCRKVDTPFRKTLMIAMHSEAS